MLQQQEDDLRQMKTSRRLRPGSLHGNFQVILLSAAHVSTSYVSWSQSRDPWLERLSILLYRLLFTVGLTTATLRWLEWPKFIFRNFSLCWTCLLVWCLECTEMGTWGESSRWPWWSGSVLMMSLQPISATSAYPLLPSQAVSICNLQRQALCWFHAPGLQLDNEVSHGTVCHQHYSHQTCQRAPSSGHWRHTFSRLPGAIEAFSWFWHRYKYTVLLTYLPYVFDRCRIF